MNEKQILASEMLSQVRNSMKYLPFTDSSVSNLFLIYIINDIILNGRRSILEFGSGISTIYISKVLSDYNIDVEFFSIEEDKTWADIVVKLIEQNNISLKPNIVVAALKPSKNSLDNLDWYDEKVIGEAVRGKKFDMLIIDGPSAWKPGFQYARYPALPYIVKNLYQNASIFLDDANRDGEKQIVQLWMQQFGLQFHIVEDDFAFANIGNYFNIRL